MRAVNFNHVSIGARDIDESLRFYTGLFGLERIPSPDFRHRVEWLRLGDFQLHLFQRETPAPEFHHVAFTVDDFEAFYVRARELGIIENTAWFRHIYELPDGSVQLYIRDPAGNLLEIDWPDASTIDRSVVTDLRRLADDVPQSEEALRSTLFLAEREQGAAA